MKSYIALANAARVAATIVVVAALLPGRAQAQAVTGGVEVGHLGILQLSCDCTVRIDRTKRERSFNFRSEPIVTSIEDGSPADRVLRHGDRITHVDGMRIVSAEGAERFANVLPGETLRLTVVRDGRTSTVRLRATSLEWNDRRVLGTLAPDVRPVTPQERVAWDEAHPGVPPAPGVPGVTPRAPREPRLATPAPRAPRAEPPVAPTEPAIAWGSEVPYSPASPSGWFGFSFRCSGCGWSLSGRDESPVWESGDEPPEITLIASRGPAARAGLMIGDRLTHIDGHAITTTEGARRLGAVKPGQKVRLTVTRDRRSLTRELTLGTRPEVKAAAAVIAARPPRPARSPATPVAPAVPRRELRYTGKLEGVSVEVWSSAGSSVERVGDTMVITVGGTVIRLKADPKK
ncbi:MAG TPA: PDZ domain-containing protein [Gemmatimonadaceae bacterium]|nr:PDZ domain-containing protein [Gemmatimonadaceae bacterium]